MPSSPSRLPLLGLGLLGLFAWFLFLQRHHTPSPSGPHTALVEVRGGRVAVDRDGLCGGAGHRQ